MTDPVLNVTDAALRQLESLRKEEEMPDAGVRVRVHEDGAYFRYELAFVRLPEPLPEDRVFQIGSFAVYVDEESLPRLRGATLEFVDELSGRGFKFENPNRPRLFENPIAETVQRVLDERINPTVATHGGRVTLMDVQDRRVFLRFGGGCQGCGMVDVTLKEGIEAMLREAVPEITEVLDVTDHASGTNPYYTSSRRDGESSASR